MLSKINIIGDNNMHKKAKNAVAFLKTAFLSSKLYVRNKIISKIVFMFLSYLVLVKNQNKLYLLFFY